MLDKSIPPYKYKGSRPIERSSPIESIKYIYLSLSLPVIFTLAFPTSAYCSSLVSMAFEDALAALPSLGQPKVRLHRWDPSRAGIRWILAAQPRRDRSDRLVPRHYKVRRYSPHVRVHSCVGPKSVPTVCISEKHFVLSSHMVKYIFLITIHM